MITLWFIVAVILFIVAGAITPYWVIEERLLDASDGKEFWQTLSAAYLVSFTVAILWPVALALVLVGVVVYGVVSLPVLWRS